MMRIFSTAAATAFAASFLFAAAARGQAFNIDFGDEFSAAGGVPPSTYGAASGQVGTWNVSSEANVPQFDVSQLIDAGGATTSVTLDVMIYGNSLGNFEFNNANTAGNDQALLDDFADIGTGTSLAQVRVIGLANGFYDVYTYSWASDLPAANNQIYPEGGTVLVTSGNDWAGSFVQGDTYVVHCVMVTDGRLIMNVQPATPTSGPGTLNGMQIVPRPTPCGASPFADACSGDGGNQTGCTDCPCGNNAAAGTVGGCLNSAARSARLLPSGIPSVAADSLHFDMSGGTTSSFAILTSGDAIAPTNPANPCFGLNSGTQAITLDGLRCAVNAVLRHGARPSDLNGDVGVTTNGWGPPNPPATGLIAASGFLAGQTRHFQVIYREDVALGCMRGQNTSQAVSLTVTP